MLLCYARNQVCAKKNCNFHKPVIALYFTNLIYWHIFNKYRFAIRHLKALYKIFVCVCFSFVWIVPFRSTRIVTFRVMAERLVEFRLFWYNFFRFFSFGNLNSAKIPFFISSIIILYVTIAFLFIFLHFLNSVCNWWLQSMRRNVQVTTKMSIDLSYVKYHPTHNQSEINLNKYRIWFKRFRTYRV